LDLKISDSKVAVSKRLVVLATAVTLVAVACFEAYNASLLVPQTEISPSPKPSSIPAGKVDFMLYMMIEGDQLLRKHK